MTPLIQTAESKIFKSVKTKAKKAYKAEKKLSLSFLQVLISNSENDEIREKSIVDYYKTSLMQLTDNLSDKYNEAAPLLNENYSNEKGLKNDDKSISLIKNFLDAIKKLKNSSSLCPKLILQVRKMICFTVSLHHYLIISAE